MDCNALKERLLADKQRCGRRPNTLNRTGRRGRLYALAGDSQTLAESSSEFSTRHTRVLQESGGDPVTILNRLIDTLQESGIPGPQLFRLQREFSKPLGEGGQGNVRGLNADAAKRYRGVHKSIRKNWAADGIAIKQHLERKSNRTHQNRFDKNSLSWRFRAAECEVLALAPGLFQNHPNIVRLVGWGLCLDTAENPTSPCCGGIQLPLLVFERAEMNLAQFLEKIFAIPLDEQSDEARLEGGLELRGRTRRPLSLSRRIWRSLRSWIPAEQDKYALVRMLCIDVGQGLKSIHENEFTHGDLKPDNILIFRVGGGWRAKLCDFGCAIGHGSDLSSTSDGISYNIEADPKQKCQRRAATYLGTDGWRPSDRELNAVRGFDELRRCDLYVYGLLVWSSFCHEGKHHSGNPRLQDMLEDVEQTTIHTKN
ncbi:hypothetical protein CGMCC3_g3763 [Colletotrichum fructicola]|uniref:Lymphokine-activated killer T-cell-originated protein kinase n=1 Tax=Colletotrichum fructicola (strain Nara gc5) TaxID=1213859 RepID=L2FFI7_COLFN|nr:uncharacterized protein CGMCC3_g3763 [Colletotrichum fructicola]KAE9580304.1 hypothetical protein CGMCC3_g3763 [Colletotrichum fructicola]KAF4479799.1 Lymphokine-activated killer T-cell-originated protein kinase [Colletotrichum fructicola Nara gc5]